jgi:dTDP-4-amino-4,6-dideoxygalactose transaminase
MDPLRQIADRHGIKLVEDCAQSHIAEYKGKPVGGLGAASSFSYYPGKNLGAYGEGGAVATNDDALAQRFRMIRDHGAQQKYQHEIYGHNYRMEGIQGAVLGVKLRHLAAWTDARRAVAAKYRAQLAGCDGVVVPAEMPYAKHVYHLFVIQVRDGGSERRDRLAKHLGEREISTGLHYPVPLHLQKCFAGLGYRQGQFPATERLASHGLSLPMFAELTDGQIEHVCASITSFFDAGN